MSPGLRAGRPYPGSNATTGTAADWRVFAALREFTGNDEAALPALDSAVKLSP